VKEILKTIELLKTIVIMGQCHSGCHFAFQAIGGIDKILIDFNKVIVCLSCLKLK
jgi:hypothetical protein